MYNTNDRPQITLHKFIQLTRERYYRIKKKKHNSKFSNLKFVLIALVLLNRPVRPNEIEEFITRNKGKSQYRQNYTVWDNVHDQVKYYLAQLIKEKIDIAQKLDNGDYQLKYRVIPPPIKMDLDFYKEHDELDLLFIIQSLQDIRERCRIMLEVLQGEES